MVRTRRHIVAATVAVLAWGALAFGANYPWAYTPLMIGAALIGLAGVLSPAAETRVPRSVVWGLISVAAATSLQLVPLPHTTIDWLSPGTHRFLQNYSIDYALAAASEAPAFHPLSIEPPRTVLALAFLSALSLLLVGTSRVLTGEGLRLLVGSIAVLGVVLSLVGIVQQSWWNGKIYGFWEPLAPGSPFGPFVNRNHFAGWMLMAVPLTLGFVAALIGREARAVKPGFRNRMLWLGSKQASQSVLLIAATIVMALALVLTFSRSGAVGFMTGTGCVVAVAVRRRIAGEGRPILLAYLLLLPVAVAAWVGYDAIIGRFASTDLTVSGRWPLWLESWGIAKEFAPTGSGLNTYGYATLFSEVRQYGHLREAHNEYLQLAVEGGWLAGIPIATTLLLFGREVLRRFKDDERQGSGYWIRVGAVAAIIAIGVQSAADFSLQMPGNAALFAVVCGIALHQAGRAKAHRSLDRDATTRAAVARKL